MSWKCPHCGFDWPDDKRRCDNDGFIRYGRLTLTGASGQRLVFGIDADLGRRLLEPLVGVDANVISTRQFLVQKVSSLESWAVSHCPEATNQTCLDGAPVTGTTSLAAGAVISVGTDKARLTVGIVYDA